MGAAISIFHAIQQAGRALEKEPDYSRVEESTKSKSKHEESCPVGGVMPRSLEMLPLHYLSSVGIRQSCSTREDEQKEKGVRK